MTETSPSCGKSACQSDARNQERVAEEHQQVGAGGVLGREDDLIWGQVDNLFYGLGGLGLLPVGWLLVAYRLTKSAYADSVFRKLI